MKRLFAFTILLLLFSCASYKTDAMSLDSATLSVANDIKNAEVDGVLAVSTINSQSSELSLQIIRMMESKLVRNRSLQLVSRTQIEVVIAEQEFGLSGYVDDNSAQLLGHLLGAKYVLVGEITKPESAFFLNIQVLETESARLVYSDTFEIDRRELRNYERKTTPNSEAEKPSVLRF
jgi:curli biogenesis system outer membrane secretion channel CsgG